MADKIYKVGESWPSPDGNKCKNITCVQIPNKQELLKQEIVENCKKDCAKGWEYKESETQCCGECIQTSCIVSNELKKPGETWMSDDGCVTYSCENLAGQLLVSSHQESCPSLGECPSENVYMKGCCKYCNITSEPMSLCSPQAIHLEKTVGLIKVVSKDNGKCINKHPVKHFTECIGTCHSSTFFNIKSGLHESVCSCCQATNFQSLKVELECENGYKWTKKVAVPSQCSCRACGEASLYLGGPTQAPIYQMDMRSQD